MVKDYPLEECAETAEKVIKKGARVFQKWTCGKCGERVTANNPNVFTTEGYHEDCGHTTDLKKAGCNYMVVASNYDAIRAYLRELGDKL